MTLLTKAMEIKARSVSGITFTLQVNNSDTINNVKTKILELAEEIPRHWGLIMVYNGRALENERTLKDYNIQNGSTIHFVVTREIQKKATTLKQNGKHGGVFCFCLI